MVGGLGRFVTFDERVVEQREVLNDDFIFLEDLLCRHGSLEGVEDSHSTS